MNIGNMSSGINQTKRWDGYEMETSPDGGWVAYEDYATLQQQLAAAREELDGCKAALHIACGERSLAREALRGLIDHVDCETCTHEETHRGGHIWTICDSCGRKWADDEGGFVPHQDAPAVAIARATLQRDRQP